MLSMGPKRETRCRCDRGAGADPNGLCFSPDYKKLYVISTARDREIRGSGGKGNIFVFDVGADNKLSNQKAVRDCVVDGVKCGSGWHARDVDGNLWVSSNAGRAVGYNGVTVWNPEGKLIGRIRTPEVVGNVCFGGPKRNRLFMAGSQSLYALVTGTQGAAPSLKLAFTVRRTAVDSMHRPPSCERRTIGKKARAVTPSFGLSLLICRDQPASACGRLASCD